jgi:hypothetical protein
MACSQSPASWRAPSSKRSPERSCGWPSATSVGPAVGAPDDRLRPIFRRRSRRRPRAGRRATARAAPHDIMCAERPSVVKHRARRRFNCCPARSAGRRSASPVCSPVARGAAIGCGALHLEALHVIDARLAASASTRRSTETNYAGRPRARASRPARRHAGSGRRHRRSAALLAGGLAEAESAMQRARSARRRRRANSRGARPPIARRSFVARRVSGTAAGPGATTIARAAAARRPRRRELLVELAAGLLLVSHAS